VKLLVYRYGGIGDTLTLTPFLFSLRNKFDRIVLCGNSERLSLIEPSLYDSIIDSDIGYDKMIAEAKEADLSIAFSERKALLFKERLSPFSTQENIYEHMYNCAIRFGGERRRLIIKSGEGNGVIIFPGAGSRSKRADIEIFFEIAKQYTSPLFLLGPAELDLYDIIKEKGFPLLIPDSLKQLKEIILQCSIFYGNDSGPAHLAALNGLETHIYYISSDPKIWMPPGNVKIMKVQKAKK